MAGGFQGREGEQIPEMTPEVVKGITERYIELYEHVTGEKFVPAAEGDILSRIEQNINNALKTI